MRTGVESRLTRRERAFTGAVAGGCAGGAVSAVLHPIDTIKTILQASPVSAAPASPTSSVLRSYTGPIDCVRHIVRVRGVRRLYRGLGAATAGSVPSSAIYFATYESLKLKIGALAAAVTGNAVSSLVFVPKEVAKQRMQVGEMGSLFAALRTIVGESGVPGLYRGYVAAILRNAPSNAINFWTFESLRRMQLERKGAECGGTLSAGESALTGAVSGVTAAVLTTPLDVAKTRMMTTKGGKVALKTGIGMYNGLVPTLRNILETDGTRGLFRGMAPRTLYSALFGATGFLAFEQMRGRIALAILASRETTREEGSKN